MGTALTVQQARDLFLSAQALLDNPERAATRASVEKLIKQLGFVQIDSINYVERAHHLTLGSRLNGYRPHLLHDLLEKKHTLFEHWTHDASAIPCEWFPHWKPRFERFIERAKKSTWWKTRMGSDPLKVMEQVRRRIEGEGPLLSRDFEHDAKNHPLPEKGWWGWKPQKVALEVLWRTGELAIARRINFQKVYDLTHRVLPHLSEMATPEREQHVEWACTTAMERLGVATPKELADFWNAIYAADAQQWCAAAEAEGRIVRVEITPAGGEDKPKRAFAPHDWHKRLAKLPPPPSRTRLLCPFDPIIRDRKRLLHLFGFDYRFEAFVPEAKRVHGYYVMPILEGDRLVGRVDPKFDRARGTLVIRSVWWEKGIRPTRPRKVALQDAVHRLATLIGADRFEIER